MNICFEGQRVLVTGADRGIGHEITKAFAKSGAKNVFAISRKTPNLQKLVSELPNVVPISVDVADWNATRKAVENIGPIDVLVNNVGTATGEPFLEVKPETYDVTFDVNVKSLINISQVVAAGMVKRKKGGAVVNLSSQASKIALWEHTVYSATKAAVDSITRSMALELGQYNIRTNAVNPTVVWTEMGRKGWSDPKKSKPLLDRIPMHKFAEIEDVVNAVLFLASDKAAMVNGTTLPIDGGILAV